MLREEIVKDIFMQCSGVAPDFELYANAAIALFCVESNDIEENYA